MDVVQLRKELGDYTRSLFNEGFLDDQFNQLQQLQDESNPEFVVEVVSLFFQDSQRLVNELAKALDQQSVDFRKVDAHVHQLKGSSSRVYSSFLSTAKLLSKEIKKERKWKKSGSSSKGGKYSGGATTKRKNKRVIGKATTPEHVQK